MSNKSGLGRNRATHYLFIAVLGLQARRLQDLRPFHQATVEKGTVIQGTWEAVTTAGRAGSEAPWIPAVGGSSPSRLGVQGSRPYPSPLSPEVGLGPLGMLQAAQEKSGYGQMIQVSLGTEEQKGHCPAGLAWPKWALCWPHPPCSLGRFVLNSMWVTQSTPLASISWNKSHQVLQPP